ncbi:MAG: zinc-ribbon domain-containing protein [Bacillota bacterium]
MPFCPHCGHQVAEGIQFCTHCGKALAQSPLPDKFQAPWQPYQPPPPRRGWLVWLAAALGLAVVAGASVAAYLLFFGPTPKQLFLAAQARYVVDSLKEVEGALGPLLPMQQRMEKEPFQSTVKLSADFNLNETVPQAEQVRSLLKQSSLVVNAQRDPAADRQLTELKLNVRGGELLSAEFYQSPEELALKVPILHDKYLHLENRDLRSAFQSKGIPWTGPNRILTRKDYQTHLTLDPAKYLPVVKEYAGYVTEFIHDDEVTLEKNYRYASPDGEVKAKRVTLTLTEERVKEFFVGLGRKFKDDEQALDLVVANTSGIATLMLESGSVSGPDRKQLERLRDKEYVRQSIQEGVEEWEAEWGRLRLPQGLTIALVLDGRNRLVQEEIRMTVVGEGDAEADVAITLTRWDGKDAKDRSLLVTVRESKGDEVALEWKSHTTPSGADGQTTRTSVKAWETKGNRQEAVLQANVTTTLTKGVESGKDKRTADFAFESTPKEPAVSGSLSTVHSSQASGNRFESLSTLNLTIDPRNTYEPKVTLTFNTDSAVEFGVSPAFPTFSATNSLNLNRMSRGEFNGLMLELQRAAERFVMKNATLFMN